MTPPIIVQYSNINFPKKKKKKKKTLKLHVES